MAPSSKGHDTTHQGNDPSHEAHRDPHHGHGEPEQGHEQIHGEHEEPNGSHGDTHQGNRPSHESHREPHGEHGEPEQGHEQSHGDHSEPQRQGAQASHSHHAMMVEDYRKRFIVSVLLTIPILILSPMLQMWAGFGESLRFSGDTFILFILSSALFLYGGYPFYTGLVRELRQRTPGMMTLIGVAIITAYSYSTAVVAGIAGLSGETFFWELATLIDIMLFGHYIEMKSVMGTSRALSELARLMPAVAHRLGPDGQMNDIPLEDVAAGDQVVVRPGERVPADGVVVQGSSAVDESMLTGESIPVRKTEGSPVIGGSVNAGGALTIRVEKTGEDSFIAQVLRLVEDAQAVKSRTQNLADRAALWLTLIALTGGAITLAGWYFIASEPLSFALERSVTVMVITCPHALGLAIPLVVTVSTALAARNGFLIRDRTAFENARNIGAVIFDKTGTLTEGKFGVTDVVVIGDACSEQELRLFAASLERYSEHPIARAIAALVDNHLDVEDFLALPGKGVEGIIQGKRVRVISPGYLREEGLLQDWELAGLSSQGKTLVFVTLDDALCGAIALADIIRPESRQAVASLKSAGIRCMMLTGDREEVASWVSREVGLDEYVAGVLPQEKAAAVQAIQERGLIVAMVGDGVNDAPALAQADVGIAIGAGTDVAIESADIVLVKNDPRDVASVIGLGKKTYRKMVQNLAWATGYNAFAIPLAAGILFGYGILLSPAAGAILMSVSTVIVAINARLLRF